MFHVEQNRLQDGPRAAAAASPAGMPKGYGAGGGAGRMFHVEHTGNAPRRRAGKKRGSLCVLPRFINFPPPRRARPGALPSADPKRGAPPPGKALSAVRHR